MGSLFGKPANSSPELYAGMQVSTSLQGQVIPWVCGRTKVNFNLLWYGNFTATGTGGGGKGGGGAPSSYNYSSAWIAALALGPIKGIYTVYHDRSITSLTYENLSYALGSLGQATWTGYPSGTPSVQKIPYSNIAYVATPNYNLGSSASMPNLQFEIEGIVGGYSDAYNIFDADISAAVVDYLTNPITGAGFAGTIPTLTGTTNTFQSYCMALGLMVSYYENNQRAASDFIKEVMQIANSDVVDSCGVLRFVPYADAPVSGTTADGTTWSYTPNLTPIYIFNDGDYCPKDGEDPVILKRKPTTDVPNIVNLEFLDRSDYYNPSPAAASDNWDISIRGPRCMSTITLHAITNAVTARQVAQLILNTQLYERNTYEFRVRRDYWLLEPMDYIGINDSGLGLTNQVCRIVQIDEDEDDFLTFTVMEVPGTIRNTPLYNWNSAEGYFQNFDEAPGSVQTPAIFNMPPIPQAISGGITVGIAVCGQTSEAFWGGCNIYASVDGGNTYGPIGMVATNGPAKYGTLTTAVVVEPDPDTVSTLAVTLSNTNLQLSTAVTDADANAMQTLILVGSGSTAEVMAYGSGTLVGAGQYDLSYLRRGLYGSTIQPQSAGAQFVYLDGAIFEVAFDPGMAGQTVYFKFCSFNSVGRNPEDLSAVTAYAYTLPAGISVVGDFLAEGNAVVVGTSAYKAGTPTDLAPTIFANSTGIYANSTTIYANNSGYTLPSSTVYANAIDLYANDDEVFANGGAASTLAWDSSVYSRQSYLDGCSISCFPYTAASEFVVGLSLDPTASVSYTNIAYGLVPTDGNTIQIYESGVYIGTFATSYDSGTLLNVTYDGKHVSYYIAGTLVRSVPITGQTFFGQIAFYIPGDGAFGIEFTPNGTAVTPFTLVPMSSNVAASGTRVTSNANGSPSWGTKNFKSAQAFTGGCVVSAEWQAGGAQFIGLSAAPTVGEAGGFGPILAGWYPHPDSGDTEILFNGADLGSYGAPPSASDVFTIVYDGFNFYWYRNNVLTLQKPWPNAGALYLFGDFFEANSAFVNVSFQPYSSATPQQFVARGLVSFSDTNVHKSVNDGLWTTGDAYSIQGYTTAHVAFKADQTNAGFMVGLVAGGQPQTINYTGISYALYPDVHGNLEIYESGTYIASYGAYKTTDLLAITYDGATVKYLQNGNVLRSVTVAGLTMFGYVNFYNSGGLNSLEFGPSALVGVLDTAQLGVAAATAVYSTTVSTSSSVATSGSVGTAAQQIATLTVPALGFATNDVITATGFVNHNAGSGVQTTTAGSLSTFSWIGVTLAYGENTLARNPSTSDPVSQTSFSLENVLSNPGTATVTYYFSASMPSSGSGASSVLSGVTFKVEQIKR